MAGVKFLGGLTTLGLFELVVGAYVAQILLRKIYGVFIYPRYVSPLRHLPGPKDGHFLLGQFVNQLTAASPLEPFMTWAKEWPDAPLIRYLSFGNCEAIMINDMAAYREVEFAKCYSFGKPDFFKRMIGEVVGNGMFFADGDVHKSQRKTFNAFFSLTNIKAFVPVFRNHALSLVDVVETAINKNGGEFEVGPASNKTFLDIIAAFATGLEVPEIDAAYFATNPSNLSSSYKAYHDIVEPGIAGQLLWAANAFVPIRWLPNEANQKWVRANNSVHERIRQVIVRRLADMTAAKGEKHAERPDSKEERPGAMTRPRDLLTFAIEERVLNASPEDRWDADDILNQLLAFMIAGHETTATALVWTVHELSRNAAIAERLHAEVDAMFRQNPNPGYSEVEHLPYLSNFTRELLRIHQSSVNAPREATEDVVIQGTTIPKGTTVLMVMASMNRKKSIWGEDADVFDPDRWDRLEGTPASDPHAFQTFLWGPRGCIGRAFAMLELKVVVVELVRRFKFESVGDKDRTIALQSPSPLMKPKDPLTVRAKRWQDSKI